MSTQIILLIYEILCWIGVYYRDREWQYLCFEEIQNILDMISIIYSIVYCCFRIRFSDWHLDLSPEDALKQYKKLNTTSEKLYADSLPITGAILILLSFLQY